MLSIEFELLDMHGLTRYDFKMCSKEFIFLGSCCCYRQPRQPLRLQRCQNRKTGYGYVQGQKVSEESFGQKNGETHMR